MSLSVEASTSGERSTTMESEQGTVVELYIYDLTNGLASLLSPSILGK